MKKSISSRFKVTKTGKVLRRQMGVSHFKAKGGGKRTRQKRRMRQVGLGDIKAIREFAGSNI